MDWDALAGRQVLASQVPAACQELGQKTAAIAADRCQRCGSDDLALLPSGCRYCRACISIGRLDEDDVLLRFPSRSFVPIKSVLTWQGQLKAKQAQVAQQLQQNFRQGKASLVHAVTGAGKTEILFPLLAQCLERGLRVAIASPRIDVVNELYPRLSSAFSGLKIGCYQSKSEQEIACLRLTICTTHQLLKFYHAFDLLIIDEVDSFPFVDNQVLHFAAANAVKQVNQLVYLTATPTADLLTQVRSGQIQELQLKRRFHGGLLPVPREKLFIKPFLQQNRINPRLLQEIKRAVVSGHPLLLFVPRINQIEAWLKCLRAALPLSPRSLAGVHAVDPQRLEKVAAFRSGKLKLLVTTTILERGVTFKHVWVIVVAADDPIYNRSSLVQIAGRVGRDQADQTGLVLFCYHKYTAALRGAQQEIRMMNR
jgi:competence protein ComFA